MSYILSVVVTGKPKQQVLPSTDNELVSILCAVTLAEELMVLPMSPK